MLRSGALEKRWVGSLHRLGSSLDLKDTLSWKQKAWQGHTWTPAPKEAHGAGGQITGALTGPWTPLRKSPGGRCNTAPAEASRGRCTSAAPPGLSPPRRGKSTQSRGRNRWKRRLGSERKDPAAPAPPGPPTPRVQVTRRRGARMLVWAAGAVTGRAGGPFPLHPERDGALRTDPISTQARKLGALSLPVSLRAPLLSGSLFKSPSLPLRAWVCQKPPQTPTCPRRRPLSCKSPARSGA